MHDPLRPLLSTSLLPAGVAVLLTAAGLLASGCSGGGGGSADSLAGFVLDDVSVEPGQTWQINRPITFAFSAPIDFGTVNQNTVGIAELGGGPVVGEFLWDPNLPQRLVFQPACPTEPDLSDAGLKPGGVQYRVDVPSQENGATTVTSATGQPLALGRTLSFSTPLSGLPTELFVDPVPGPPAPVPGHVDANGVVRGTRLHFLDDGGRPDLPFVPDASGFGTLGEFLVPLNLYSDLATRFEVVLEIDQPVQPSAANVGPARLQLQFLHGAEWTPLSTEVQLSANCTASGATIRLRPVGVLPQNRELRVFLSAELEDLVGDRNVLPLDRFARMKSDAFVDPQGDPVPFADEVLEEFLLPGGDPFSLADESAVLAVPRAEWGNGALQAAFAFAGNGGPGGDFDWHVPPNTDAVLDTTSTLLLGGPGGVPTTSQVSIGGLVNVRDLFVPSSSSLRVQGPNPAVFLCSGEVRIDGTLQVNGNNAQPVFSLFTPNQPEPGASGNGGGGDGGVGSFLTNQVTPRGGNGNGAFNTPGAGGQGGESGWNPSNAGNGINRRAAGGGGGALGHDVVGSDGCYDQSRIGLDAESGFPGHPNANAATRPNQQLPWGGMPATLPFTDGNGTVDDFWGVMRKDFGTPDETLVQGELLAPWPGSGGGAGGDSTLSSTYPPPTLIPNNQTKGAGGGGGAGVLSILALGNIVLGPNGRIEAIGGHGSGGGNTAGVNRIGGGSGGGSGGTIVLQSASQIDLSSVLPDVVAISVRGGQGGAGAGDNGGAAENETTPSADAKHVGVSGPGDLGDNPWIPMGPPNCASGAGVVRAAGGDGGPGMISFHAGSLPGDVLYPGDRDETALAGAVRPTPVGYEPLERRWKDQLMPQFGRFSAAQSKWIPLGLVTLDADSGSLHPVRFLFAGTDPEDGRVLTSGGSPIELAPLLAPVSPLEAEGLPSVSPDRRTLFLDASELSEEDRIYARNAHLLRRFAIRAGDEEHRVELAVHDGGSDAFALTVPTGDPDLPSSGTVELIPRYFGVSTNGVESQLPASASVRIEFQATSATQEGQPDLTHVTPQEGWATDVEVLNQAADNPEFRFYRFRVTFDVAADDGQLSFDSPRPALRFLRTPFRF